MSSLGRRVLTGTTLAVVVAALLWAHRFFPAGGLSLAVMALLSVLCVWELDHMGSFQGRGLGWMLYPAALSTALVVALGFRALDRVGLHGGLAALYLWAAAVSLPARPIGHLVRLLDCPALTVGREVVPLAVWLLPPLFAVVLVDHGFGIEGLVVLVLLAKIGDNAAYFVGRAIGKRHPFPNISPGKTVAGCVASLVAGIVTGAIVLPLTLGERTPLHAGLGALLGGLLNVLAQAGDLSKSWVKRRAGVKDSSKLLGASGGVLDAIDSLLFAAPAALLLWAWAYPAAGR